MQKSESQTLITGVYRTGTEFITQAINCHPEISATMYRVNVLRFVDGRYDPISSQAMQRRALGDLKERLFHRYGLELDCDILLRELAGRAPVDYGVFYDLVMSWLYLGPSRRHWMEKNQLLWREIPRFIEMMPNGRAILVIRDPRSVLASFKKYTTAPPPAYLGAIFNCYDAMLAGKVLEERFASTGRFLCLRYEDFAADPENWTRAVWKMIGVSPDHGINNQGWKDAYGKEWKANSSFHTNADRKAFDVQAAIDRWRTQLSPMEIFLTEAVCAEIMTQYGYAQAGLEGVDWREAMRLPAGDDKLMGYFRNWLIKGEGIEAFPSDPLDSASWDKRRSS